jgi:WD40 repeat protein
MAASVLNEMTWTKKLMVAIGALAVMIAFSTALVLRSEHSAMAQTSSEQWRLAATFRGPETIECMAYSPDGKTLALTTTGTVRLRDAITGTELASLDQGRSLGMRRAVIGVVYSPDGKWLTTAVWHTDLPGADSTLLLWDTAARTVRARLKGHQNSVQGVGFSRDSTRLASVNRDGTVRLFKVPAGEVIRSWMAAPEIHEAVFSANGKYLATIHLDRALRLWNVATGREIRTRRFEGYENSLVFSADGKLFAVADQNSIRVWEVETGREVARLAEQLSDGVLQSLSFSGDGKTLASVSCHGVIKIWDVPTGKQRAAFQSHMRYVYSIRFSPDGTTLAAGGADLDRAGIIQLWKPLRPAGGP